MVCVIVMNDILYEPEEILGEKLSLSMIVMNDK
jgi:hypothetical protein